MSAPRNRPTKTLSPLLSVRDLSLVREQTILKKISWEILPGQHWVLLGANGSGKTSLLSALLGYQTPTSGHITLLGETYGKSDWREKRKAVGLVSSSLVARIQGEEPALATVLSGAEAMLNYWGKPKEKQLKEARALLRQVECAPLANRPWRDLSQGERQRVLIGRALMSDYRLLFLDEPCAGLDMVARETFLKFLSKISGKRNAPGMVLVTHHVEEIFPSISHALLLKGGKVLAAGKIGAVLTEKNLQRCFGKKLRLKKERGGYRSQLF